MIVLLNREDIYSAIDWIEVSVGPKKPHVLDTRGILNVQELQKLDISYDVLGSAKSPKQLS